MTFICEKKTHSLSKRENWGHNLQKNAIENVQANRAIYILWLDGQGGGVQLGIYKGKWAPWLIWGSWKRGLIITIWLSWKGQGRHGSTQTARWPCTTINVLKVSKHSSRNKMIVNMARWIDCYVWVVVRVVPTWLVGTRLRFGSWSVIEIEFSWCRRIVVVIARHFLAETSGILFFDFLMCFGNGQSCLVDFAINFFSFERVKYEHALPGRAMTSSFERELGQIGT